MYVSYSVFNFLKSDWDKEGMKEIKKGGEKEESNATEGELPEGLTEKKNKSSI